MWIAVCLEAAAVLVAAAATVAAKKAAEEEAAKIAAEAEKRVKEGMEKLGDHMLVCPALSQL